MVKENRLKKILLAFLCSSFFYSSTVSAANYTGVTVQRVTASPTGIQIWGSDGCSLQPGGSYVTTESGTDKAYYGMIMSVALSAQASGKTVSFQDDCTASGNRANDTSAAILQICVNETLLDNTRC